MYGSFNRHVTMIFLLALWVVHAAYRLVQLVQRAISFGRDTNRPLLHHRSQAPKHLSVALVGTLPAHQGEREAYVESFRRVVRWAHVSGIQNLTVFDKGGGLPPLSWSTITHSRDC